MKTPFDAELALHRTCGDRQFLSELVGVFLSEVPKLLSEIEVAISRNDAPELRRAAHTLKGAMNNFGAAKACAAAFQLESSAARGETGDADRMFAELRPLVSELAAALTEFVGQGLP